MAKNPGGDFVFTVYGNNLNVKQRKTQTMKNATRKPEALLKALQTAECLKCQPQIPEVLAWLEKTARGRTFNCSCRTSIGILTALVSTMHFASEMGRCLDPEKEKRRIG